MKNTEIQELVKQVFHSTESYSVLVSDDEIKIEGKIQEGWRFKIQINLDEFNTSQNRVGLLKGRLQEYILSIYKKYAFNSEYKYSGTHILTGEEWEILGVDVEGDRVCVSGYPPSIGCLSDIRNLKKLTVLTSDDLKHRQKEFGHGWH